jgi:AAA+ ATPase superfamily predicted ATPase
MKYLIFLISIAFVNFAYAQKVTTNRKYQPEKIQTISFTPYFNEQGNPDQDINGLFKEALSRNFEVCCQSELEHNLIKHEAFNNLAGRTIYSDLSELIRTKSNLFNTLTNSEKLELQNGCKNTDLLVITSKIDSRTVSKLNNSGNISISGNITVFDLRTGEFVAFISDEVKQKFDDMRKAGVPLNELVNSLVNGLNEAIVN